MYHDKRDLEKSKSVLLIQRESAIACMNFAIQHDMLGLFQQSREKVDALQIALNVIENHLQQL